MKSHYQAYQAYEGRVIRGELDNDPRKAGNRPALHEPLLVQFGDLLIHTGIRLKRRHAAGKPMVWSAMTGSKP
jgi:hypothetical protein